MGIDSGGCGCLMNTVEEIKQLKEKIKRLEMENHLLRAQVKNAYNTAALREKYPSPPPERIPGP